MAEQESGSSGAPGFYGLIGNTAGAMIGHFMSNGDTDTAEQLQQQALDKIRGLQTPELQNIAFQQYVQQGVLTPEMQPLVSMPDSQYQQIKTSPQFQQAQLNALQGLQQRAETGLTPVEMAQINATNRQAQQQVGQANAASLQEAQQRGGGLGIAAEMALRQNAAQGAIGNAQAANDKTSAMAYQNALGALQGAGQLGGQMQAQQFSQQAQQAQAEDVMNRFRAQQQQGVAAQNTAAQNYAQQQNLLAKQNIANQNTGLSNQQQMYNNYILPQQRYQNQVGLANLQSGAMENAAGQYQQRAANTAGLYTGFFGGTTQAAGQYGMNNQGGGGQGGGQQYQGGSQTPDSSMGGMPDEEEGASGGGGSFGGGDMMSMAMD